MTEGRSALIAHNVSVGYRKSSKRVITVLEHVNMSLQAGVVTCLIGPNGCGKSTLLRTVAGLQPLLAGKVMLSDRSLSEMGKVDLAKKMSVVLTYRSIIGNMTVRELVQLGRYPHTGWLMKMRQDDIESLNNAIELTTLTKLLHHKIGELSDGQLQKVLIARALTQDSEVMLLDEPTTHLDLNNRVEIMKLMRVLAHEQGKCILLATHELDLALQMADRLVLINQEGQLIEGIPEDLVLDGQIDETFELKGYDLKSGKAQFSPQRKTSIYVEGEGYLLLWTKNALERNGFETSTHPTTADVNIRIDAREGTKSWSLTGVESPFRNLEELLDHLTKSFS